MSGCNRVKAEEYGPHYYSERGDGYPPHLDSSVETYLHDGEEYAYLFVNNEWICYNRNEYSTGIPELVVIPSSVPLAV